MAHQDFDAFRNSQLSRKPGSKRRLLQLSLTGDHAAPPQESFYSERRKGTSAVARVVFIIVLLHVLAVGGTCLHKKLQSDDGAIAESKTTPPPAQENKSQSATTITPLPVAQESVATNTIAPNIAPSLPSVAPTPSLPSVDNTNHITAAPQDLEIVAVEIPSEAATPTEPVQPLVVTATSKHTVGKGDTWYSIAKKNKISVEQLKAANPVAGQKKDVYLGATLIIPIYGTGPAIDLAATPAVAQAAPAPAPAAVSTASTTPKIYTVVSGDTISRIAAKNKVSVDKILQLNGIKKEDAHRIQVGQKLKLTE